MKRNPLGPYRMPVPRVLGESYGGGRLPMGEVPLYDRNTLAQGVDRASSSQLKGYFTDEKTHPPRTLPYAHV